jgi:hypothetical protein
MVNKLELFRFTCTILVIGGTAFAVINPIVGVSISAGAALACILTNP